MNVIHRTLPLYRATYRTKSALCQSSTYREITIKVSAHEVIDSNYQKEKFHKYFCPQRVNNWIFFIPKYRYHLDLLGNSRNFAIKACVEIVAVPLDRCTWSGHRKANASCYEASTNVAYWLIWYKMKCQHSENDWFFIWFNFPKRKTLITLATM